MASNSNSTPFEHGLNFFGPQMPGPGHFDFSPLFEFSILSILPSALLLLVLPFRLRSLYKQSKKVTQSLLHTNKLVVLAIFTAFQAAVLILYAANSSVRTPTSMAAAVLVLIDALGLCLLSHAEHVHSLRPSTIINMYLLFTLLFDIAHIRTLWIEHAPRAIAAVFTVTVAVKFVIAVMEATEKRKILLAQYQDSNPEATSGIYSRAFFWWLNTLMTIGFRRIIREEDLFPIEEEMSSKVLGKRAQKLWSKVDQARSHALLWSTLNSIRRQLILCVFPRLCLIGFRYTQPFLLSRTTDFVKSTTNSKNIGWGLTGAFGIVFIGTAIANALYFHMTFRFATVLRGTLVSMICVKTMDLSITSLDESAAVTLMSNDTETICGGFQNVNEIWAVPLELGIAMWLLYRELGLSFLAPAAITIISTWAVTMISGSMGKSQKIWNEGIQTRVDVTTTILGSMKAVKILGFTPKVAEILQRLRVKELKLSSFFRRLLCCTAFFSNSMRTLAGFVTFLVFVLIENYSKIELTAATAFTVLSLIGMLSTPVSTLLRTIPQLKSALACFDRIQKFLESPPRQPHVLPPNGPPNVDASKLNKESGIKAVSSDIVADENVELDEVHPQSRQFSGPAIIDVQNASFSWTLDGPSIIKNVSFTVLRNNFIFIIGPVGCGKSTLLKGLMGETSSSQGLVYSNTAGNAFVDQTPWVQNITIRKNIIGPSILDSVWYDEVIRACALDHDIAALPDSHDTIVGSRGISLSGGQKQRVALARALYAKKELMIIDDGFSGLDTETEESIFTKLFSNQGLLKQLRITVIVVTNAVNRLSYADHIISLDAAGRISEQGTLAQLGGSGGYVERLATKHKYESELKSDAAEDSVESTSTEPVKLAVVKKAKVEEEDLNRPIGEWSTYRYYFASIGWTRSLLSLSYLVVSGTGAKLTELLLTYWTEAISERGNYANPLYLGLYGMLAGVGTIFWSIATYHYFLYVVPGSAEELHARLLRSVMNAPLHFFTSTDTGITTNRFSQDMSVVDKELPFALIDLIVAAVQAFVGAILMCLVTGYFALTLPPVIFIVWVIQKFYLRTSRQVRLLDLEAKSPLYTHFIESLSGLATIRAFGWSEEFVQQNLVLLDNSQKPYYLLFCIQRWLSIVLDLMITVLAVILMILVVELRDSVSAGYVGLAVLNVISFSASLSWIIRQWTSLETSIGAVSRLKKFTSTTLNENLPEENQTVPDTWPEHGAITIKSLKASYSSDGSPVLTNINMEIKAGKKIGICGRTGSGKSSLISTLFRLLEISPESSIIVDGIDITKIPRQVIRSRFNAIPQDTFFIPGTIRLNLSPETQQNTDADIISALQKVELWTLVESKGGLDAKLETEFFSHGQRQLFSFARAILKKSKIVVLDEVSSSIDFETDKLIQALLRREFEGATILSIAHRLNTIVDFEKVAVLGDGRLIEFDEPRVLLGREGSAFAELYKGV